MDHCHGYGSVFGVFLCVFTNSNKYTYEPSPGTWHLKQEWTLIQVAVKILIRDIYFIMIQLVLEKDLFTSAFGIECSYRIEVRNSSSSDVKYVFVFALFCTAEIKMEIHVYTCLIQLLGNCIGSPSICDCTFSSSC